MVEGLVGAEVSQTELESSELGSYKVGLWGSSRVGLELGLEVRWRGKGRCELGKLEEGLLGQGGGGECAGKSEAGCPGHRIIVVKYSWAFGPDAISEQRERASGRSLERCCSPLAPTAATGSPDRPRDAHHVHTHTLQLTHTHTHTCIRAHTKWSFVARASTPATHGSHKQTDAPHTWTCTHTLSPRTPLPAISQALVPSLPKQRRLTALSTTLQNRQDGQRHVFQPPPMSG